MDEMTPIEQLKQAVPDMTKSDLKIYNYLINHQHEVIYYSLTDFSDAVEVSEATVLRFFKKRGFQGFQAFKFELAKAMENPQPSEHNQLHTMIERLKKSEAMIDPVALEQVVNIINQTHEIVLFAVGASKIIALDFQDQLLRIGKVVSVVGDADHQIMRAHTLTKDSLVIAISLSGSTTSLVEHVKIARDNQATIISLTGFIKSPLQALSDHVLIFHVDEHPLSRGTFSDRMSQMYLLERIYQDLKNSDPEKTTAFREAIGKDTSRSLY